MKLNEDAFPSVTLVIFAYNQENYIELAVNSVLDQDYSNLRIVISDDCSSDQTFERAKALVETYEGAHVVELRRNGQNLGLINHVNTVISQVRSELVVVAAGDDISLPKRVSKLVDVYLNSGKPKLLSSKAFKIDEDGNLLNGLTPEKVIEIEDLDSVINSLEEINDGVGLYLGATGAWSMSLWKKYGPIKHELCYEDITMGFRAALEKSYKLVDEPLVKYRVNVGLSSRVERSLRGKIALRESKVKLMRDLAKQRCDDLTLSAMKADMAVVAKIKKQALIHSIRGAFYESPLSILRYFKKYPGWTILQGLSESFFFVRAGIRAGLKAISLKNRSDNK